MEWINRIEEDDGAAIAVAIADAASVAEGIYLRRRSAGCD
jgi:hypothetical protein